MLNVNSEIENFVKNLIDMILNHTKDGNIAWNWGEETFRIDYIIDLINDLANMNYKRPYPDNDCAMCSKYYYRQKKSEHRKHCCGGKENCKDFNSVLCDR